MRSPRRQVWIRFALACAGGGTSLLLAAKALGRAGGGQHFSAGGSSSYGGSSGGGGGDLLFDLVYLALRLLFYYPQIGVPLLIVGLVIFASSRHFSDHEATRRAVQDLDEPAIRPGVDASLEAALERGDPDFTAEAFLARAKAVFLQVQEAWSLRRLAGARSAMSDGVLGRFLAQQGLMRAEGVRNALAGMEILDARVVDFQLGQFFQLLDVAIEARAGDVDVPWETDDARALAAAQRAPHERFTEIWTFARRPGVKSAAGKALGEGKCPNCGAPYAGGPTAQCGYCQAIVNSGHYDWVLCEITQPGQHRLLRALGDFGPMLARDPAFNPYTLEDRASLAFWRMLQARATGEAAAIAPVCTRAFRERTGSQVEAMRARGRRLSLGEAAVGSAELLRLDLDAEGEDGAKVDHAHVRILWSARASQVGLNERAPADAPISRFATVLVLERDASAQTPPNRGLATERCARCGAPLTEDGRAVCPSCGEELSAGTSDWVLADEVPFEQWSARASASAGADLAGLLPAFEFPAERHRLLQTMAAVARADGVVTPRERRLLHLCGQRWHLPLAAVDAMLDGPDPPAIDVPPPGSPAAGAFLRGLVAAALVDGWVDASERRLLEQVAQDLRLPTGAVQAALGDGRLREAYRAE